MVKENTRVNPQKSKKKEIEKRIGEIKDLKSVHRDELLNMERNINILKSEIDEEKRKITEEKKLGGLKAGESVEFDDIEGDSYKKSRNNFDSEAYDKEQQTKMDEKTLEIEKVFNSIEPEEADKKTKEEELEIFNRTKKLAKKMELNSEIENTESYEDLNSKREPKIKKQKEEEVKKLIDNMIDYNSKINGGSKKPETADKPKSKEGLRAGDKVEFDDVESDSFVKKERTAEDVRGEIDEILDGNKKDNENVNNSWIEEEILRPKTKENGEDIDNSWIEEEMTKPREKKIVKVEVVDEKERMDSTQAREQLKIIREEYVKELKNCLRKMDSQKTIDKTSIKTFNTLANLKNIFRKRQNKIERKVFNGNYNEEDFYSEKYKSLEQTHSSLQVALGNALMKEEKEDLIRAGLGGDKLEEAMERFKATGVLNEVIIDERQKIIDQRTKANKNIMTKAWNTYKEMPRWKKAAVGTLLFLPLSAATGVGATIAGTYGLVALAVPKTLMSMGLGYTTTAISAGAFDLLYTKKNDAYYKERKEDLKFLDDHFIKGEINESKYNKVKKEDNEKLKNRLRKQMIAKIGVSVLLGWGTGMLAYGALSHEVSNYLDNSVTDLPKTGTEIGDIDGRKTSPLVEDVKKIPTAEEISENIKGKILTNPDVIIHKGEGIEHSFIRQIEHNHELAKELGYKGDLSDTKALHEFAGRQAHIIAIKEGYVDSVTGEEVRVAEADKIGYEIKTENGGIIIEEKSVDGKIIETHHEGDKFEQKLEKGEYSDKGTVNDKNYQPPQQTDPWTHSEPIPGSENLDGQHLAPEQTDPWIKSEQIPEGEGKEVSKDFLMDHSQGIKPIEMSPLNENVDSSTLAEGIEEFEFSPQELRQINRVHEHNIDQIFSNKGEIEIWEKIKGWSAEKLYDQNSSVLKPEYKSLQNYLHKLGEATGLRPIRETMIQRAETNFEFIERALKRAMKLDRLREVEL